MNIKDRFHNSVDSLYDYNCYIARYVSRLGYPEEVDGYPPTAGVMWDKDTNKIKFLFNKRFNQAVNGEEFNFAVAHEMIHVMNGHIFILKSELDRMKSQNKDSKEISAFMRKFNIAADCVVNDSLINLYKFPKITFDDVLNNKTEVPAIFYGKETVGCHCHNLSVTDVMELIPEGLEQNSDDHSGWESFFSSGGNLDKEFIDSMKEFLDSCQKNSCLSEQDIEVAENLEKEMESCSDSYASSAGNGNSSRMKKINLQKAKMNWERIFLRKVGSKKFEDVWNRYNRKLVSFYPDVILPYNQDKEVEDIFLAIDVSGSIDWNALDLFVSLVKNIPKRFRVSAITFNTACQSFDIENSSQIRSGGGTRFDIIEDYIQKNFKKYPKNVIVLTDGQGNRVDPANPSRWTWLLYGPMYNNYCKNMTHYKLEELLR